MESADLFSSLLQNPETMQKLAGIASELMGGGNPPPIASQSSDYAGPPAKSETSSEYQPSFSFPDDLNTDFMRRLAPALSVISQSGKSPANPARFQLLCALKPFVSPHTREQIDHAEHLLRMARMAQTAAEQFMPQLYSGREG
ncbi:MAG: hypothetical protein Q4P20_07220 [Eubacteriales bacterium]|nr:hypothetical protein [Eubacteriales bacterium]